MQPSNARLHPSRWREGVEQFVRGTLGCQCPDEVFRSVTLDRVHAGNGLPGTTRLAIGDRLLVYVMRAADSEDLVTAVGALTLSGIADRDSHGMNRFRLVLARRADDPGPGDVQRAFAVAAGPDDRAHLHVIDAAALPRGL